MLSRENLLRGMFKAAIDAADPAAVLARHLPEKPEGRCIVIGAGKWAAAMARAVERAWTDVDVSGVVVTRYGHAVPTERIIVREASHPLPDAAGEAVAHEILETARAAGSGDLVLALISGGGSALLTLPVPPLTRAEKIEVNRLLLRSGLTIDDMNRVRRRLSLIKGGGLARAAGPARLVTLAISDVPGDHPAAVASGPTVPDPSAGEDLSDLVNRLGPRLPEAARDLLLAPVKDTQGFDAIYTSAALRKPTTAGGFHTAAAYSCRSASVACRHAASPEPAGPACRRDPFQSTSLMRTKRASVPESCMAGSNAASTALFICSSASSCFAKHPREHG